MGIAEAIDIPAKHVELPWWDDLKHVEIEKWSDWWHTWWRNDLPQGLRFALFDILVEHIWWPDWTYNAVSFLLKILNRPPGHEIDFPPKNLTALYEKAVEVFMLKFLKGPPVEDERSPAWVVVFVNYPSLYRDVLACLVGCRHVTAFSNTQHHYQSIVKKFLDRCLRPYAWERGDDRNTLSDVINNNLVETYRALFAYGMDSLILERRNNETLKALEELFKEPGGIGDQDVAKNAEDAIIRDISGIDTFQVDAAMCYIKVKLLMKRDQREREESQKRYKR